MDKGFESLSCKPKSRKWIMVCFSYVLDMVRINSSTIVALNYGIPSRSRQCDSFSFGWELAKAFIQPFIRTRPRNDLGKLTQMNMSLDLLEQLKSSVAKPSKRAARKKSQCFSCQDEFSGAGYKVQRKKMSKVKSVCEECRTPTCPKHKYVKSGCKECRSK